VVGSNVHEPPHGPSLLPWARQGHVLLAINLPAVPHLYHCAPAKPHSWHSEAEHGSGGALWEPQSRCSKPSVSGSADRMCKCAHPAPRAGKGPHERASAVLLCRGTVHARHFSRQHPCHAEGTSGKCMACLATVRARAPPSVLACNRALGAL